MEGPKARVAWESDFHRTPAPSSPGLLLYTQKAASDAAPPLNGRLILKTILPGLPEGIDRTQKGVGLTELHGVADVQDGGPADEQVDVGVDPGVALRHGSDYSWSRRTVT